MIHPTSTRWYVIDNFIFFDPPYYYLLVGLQSGLGLRHFNFNDPPYYYLLVELGLGLWLGFRHYTFCDPSYY